MQAASYQLYLSIVKSVNPYSIFHVNPCIFIIVPYTKCIYTDLPPKTESSAFQAIIATSRPLIVFILFSGPCSDVLLIGHAKNASIQFNRAMNIHRRRLPNESISARRSISDARVSVQDGGRNRNDTTSVVGCRVPSPGEAADRSAGQPGAPLRMALLSTPRRTESSGQDYGSCDWSTNESTLFVLLYELYI